MSNDKRPDIIRHVVSSKGEPFVRDMDLRGNQVNTNDIDHVYSLGLSDIDAAIMGHIADTLVPMVEVAGKAIQVPVMYGDPEIWASVKKTGTVRDANSEKIAYPLIVVNRTSIEKDRTGPTKMDANNANNIYAYKTTYTKENRYDKFSALNNRVPVQEYKIIAIPDFVKVIYDIVILTDFQIHNNKIVEQFEYASDSYWGKGNNTYLSTIESIPMSTEFDNENGGRIIKSEFQLTTRGYILPDSLIRHLSSFMKKFSKAVVNIKIDEI